MMMRIMNQHSEVHSINEPHFFGSLWSPADEDRVIEREEAKLLFLKLFTRQRAGFFEKVDKHKAKYKTEVDSLLSTWPMRKSSRERTSIHISCTMRLHLTPRVFPVKRPLRTSFT